MIYQLIVPRNGNLDKLEILVSCQKNLFLIE
ncbi:hypothetical protein J2Z76_000071 [Sedimentibacter acidaminivorans]|uniref:NERD domain-containing protein n=1 Tax=Sedimentibacter acidaminivorans TaxID=913099 RepID=A0ABS4G952_9FIRM|nr:hypothetical protein [Sedimentibacter acidaminivorans]